MIKIYRYVQGTGAKVEGIKMIGFSRAEVTFKRREEANKVMEEGQKREGYVGAFIPERMRFRKGVIREWPGTMEELKNEAMPGQGHFILEKLRRGPVIEGRRGRQDDEEEPLLIVFKGDKLPTTLLIGQGHVGVKIWPYIERVKQCYVCWKFGHTQKFCKLRRPLCGRCREEKHGVCKKIEKCVNCKGNHEAFAKSCWVYQKEFAIKKVMAYKNVAFETARSIVERAVGIEGIRLEDDMGEVNESRDFPRLTKRKVIEMWEGKEVPMWDEVENIRKGFANAKGVNLKERVKMGVRTEEGNSKGKNIGLGNASGWAEVVRRGERNEMDRGARCGERRDEVEGQEIEVSNNFEVLQEEGQARGMEEVGVRGEGGITCRRRIPFPHDLVGEEPEGKAEYDEYKIVTDVWRRERERKAIREAKKMAMQEIEAMKKKADDELIEELIKLVEERGLKVAFAEEVKARKYRASKEVAPDPDEDWNEIRTPNFLMYIDPKTEERTRRKIAREKKKVEEKRLEQEKYEEMVRKYLFGKGEKKEEVQKEKEEEKEELRTGNGNINVPAM
ncbi:uncharacterized protein LOC105663508 [Megachile rotundata]|uniref:uncharacterized protein LOC105663508 n=1 Tax=Megachile rotundata TaxID=143995 RepID=UPI003FD09A78